MEAAYINALNLECAPSRGGTGDEGVKGVDRGHGRRARTPDRDGGGSPVRWDGWSKARYIRRPTRGHIDGLRSRHRRNRARPARAAAGGLLRTGVARALAGRRSANACSTAIRLYTSVWATTPTRSTLSWCACKTAKRRSWRSRLAGDSGHRISPGQLVMVEDCPPATSVVPSRGRDSCLCDHCPVQKSSTVLVGTGYA